MPYSPSNSQTLMSLLEGNPNNTYLQKAFVDNVSQYGMGQSQSMPQFDDTAFMSASDFGNLKKQQEKQMRAQQAQMEAQRQQALMDQYGTFKGQLDTRNDLEKNIGGIPVLGGLLGAIGDVSRGGAAGASSVLGDTGAFIGNELRGAVGKDKMNLNFTNPFQEAINAASDPNKAKYVGSQFENIIGEKVDPLFKGGLDFASQLALDPTNLAGGAGVLSKLGKVGNIADKAGTLGNTLGRFSEKLPVLGEIAKGFRGTEKIADIAKPITGGYKDIQSVKGFSGGWLPENSGFSMGQQSEMLNKAKGLGIPLNPKVYDGVDTFTKNLNSVKRSILDDLSTDPKNLISIDKIKSIIKNVSGTERAQLEEFISKNLPEATQFRGTTPSYTPTDFYNLLQKAGQNAADVNMPNSLKKAFGQLSDSGKGLIDNISGEIKIDPSDVMNGTGSFLDLKSLSTEVNNVRSIKDLNKLERLGIYLKEGAGQGLEKSTAPGGGLPSWLPFGDKLEGALSGASIPNINRMIGGAGNIESNGLRYGAGEMGRNVVDKLGGLKDTFLNSKVGELAQKAPINLYGMGGRMGGANTAFAEENPAMAPQYIDKSNGGDNIGVIDQLLSNSQQNNQLFNMLLQQGYKPNEAKQIADENAPKLSGANQKQVIASQQALSTLSRLEKAFEQAGGGQGFIGGTLAELGGKIGANSGVKTYNDLKTGLIAQLSKALGNTGAFTDADAKRAEQLIGEFGNDSKTAKDKFDSIRNQLMENLSIVASSSAY